MHIVLNMIPKQMNNTLKTVLLCNHKTSLSRVCIAKYTKCHFTLQFALINS